MMKKLALIIACMLIIGSGAAFADTLQTGSTYTAISISFNGTNTTWNGVVGGGSFNTSYLNGSQLPWIYCVDLEHTIGLSTQYDATQVSLDGIVNGTDVANKKQVAWLLSTYADSAISTDEMGGLQAAIWEVIYGTQFAFTGGGSMLTEYNKYFDAVSAVTNPPDLVANFDWLSPQKGGSSTTYQGEVTRVPEPSLLLLLSMGIGAAALVSRRWNR
jgi:hypothetical protein